jgi:glycosyltransferase involved in cell wall biosynthesis
MLPLISVIVPVYNVEKYLKRCIDSIIKQTYKNLEIILVDDGSTDSSGDICDQYGISDLRIKIIHKQNGGLSSARNAGIDKSTGELIAFIDSDDYIHPEMLEFLQNEISQKDVDIAICGRYIVYENGKSIIKEKKCDGIIMESEDAIRKMCSYDYFDMSSCDRLFIKALFQSVRYPEKKLCEDWHVMHILFDLAKRISYNSIPLYYYYQRENSISRNVGINVAAIEASESVLTFVKERYPGIIDEAATSFAFASISIYNNYIKYGRACDPGLMKRLKSNVNANLKYILRNKSISGMKKIQAFVFCINIYLYKIFFTLLKLKK